MKHKHLLILPLVVAMMLSSLAGCASKPAAPAADAPKTDAAAPAADAPKTDAPAADAPKADATPAAGVKEVSLYSNKVEIDEALKGYAATYEKQSGTKVNITTIGGGADYGGTLKAQLQSGTFPEIFVVEGPSGYELWKDSLADLSNEPWVKDTDVAYKSPEGKVVGFPVAVEGYGMGYNKDILDKAGIDPKTLTNIAAYKKAFETLDAKKKDLGLDCVVSMAAGPEMTWVTGLHSFNTYLTNGLKYDDTTYIDKFLAGQLDTDRFKQYADYLALIFKYSNKKVLLTGNYDAQLADFTSQKAAFIHQGNWIDPSIATANVSFKMGYAPHGWMTQDTDGIFVAPPSWYVINKDRPGAEEAKKFLTAMATTPEGQDYMVNKAGMVPAFKSVTIRPAGQFSASVMDWSNSGKIYSWQQYKMPDGFGMKTLGPIYSQFASGAINEDKFVQLVAAEVAKAKK